tara:strand:- start:82 stop:678 length:597 start_codon:yes stop_codon:yes gene_type:complete
MIRVTKSKVSYFSLISATFLVLVNQPSFANSLMEQFKTSDLHCGLAAQVKYGEFHNYRYEVMSSVSLADQVQQWIDEMDEAEKSITLGEAKANGALKIRANNGVLLLKMGEDVLGEFEIVSSDDGGDSAYVKGLQKFFDDYMHPMNPVVTVSTASQEMGKRQKDATIANLFLGGTTPDTYTSHMVSSQSYICEFVETF